MANKANKSRKIDTVHKSRRPGRPRDPVRREDLLRVARHAFGELGYAGTSVHEIGRRTGLRAASLLHHFPTKEAMYCEVMAHLVSDLKDLVLSTGLMKGSFVSILNRLGEMVEDYLADHQEAACLLVREMMDSGPFMQRSGRELVMETIGAVKSFLVAGMRAGVFSEQDPHQLAISIISVHLFNFLVVDLTLPEGMSLDMSNDAARQRKKAVLAHVRRLCGVAP